MQILFSKNFKYYCFSNQHVFLSHLLLCANRVCYEYCFTMLQKCKNELKNGFSLLQKCKSFCFKATYCYKSANQIEKWFLHATKAQIKLKNGFLMLQKCKPN